MSTKKVSKIEKNFDSLYNIKFPDIKRNTREFWFRQYVLDELGYAPDNECNMISYEELYKKVIGIKRCYLKYFKYHAEKVTLNKMFNEFKEKEDIAELLGLDRYAPFNVMWNKIKGLQLSLQRKNKMIDRGIMI